ncbi:CBS domain-containing protein [Calothrix sp. UHCC 0171]|uniref:CBS domain-containing protein n=1 Tax=Calothrix sp. UHCC 0171 TaxID=3110245 RepID=UPI002B20BB99|nr:CBS domain-containing protein [Calothrix sp. UHCC 0171]MEA5572700.1 CBS domain-containing protein [Calothrix sp. UHCC 0171]
MLKAVDVMTKDVATIRSSATVTEAVKLMKARDWRALIVERRHPQDAYGIITDADIMGKVIAYGKDPSKVRVYEIMTKPCIVVNPDLGVEYVARLFADHHLLQAPVIQGELMGIVSASDIIGKSKFVELPRTILLEQELQEAIKKSHDICARTSPRSEECAAAWDVVDELQAEIAHQEAKRIEKTAFEEFCEEFPEILTRKECDEWCSG